MLIDFHGYTFRKDKIVAVGPVESIQTGTMASSWVYGFKIFLEGNTIYITPDIRYTGSGYRDAQKNTALTLRAGFVELIMD